MIYQRLDCRLCGSCLECKLKLEPTPIANSFPTLPDNSAELIPLDIMQCIDCGHVQLSHVVDSETLYDDYKYSTPYAFAEHLENHAKQLRSKYPDAINVLEIGSNNNLFIDILREHSFHAIGIDPASPIEKCRHRFTEEYAGVLKDEGWMFDLVLANNVFAHIDNLQNVFRGIRNVLRPDGAIVFEVQYLPAMLRNGKFDMIYHEHHDYHHLKPLARFLGKMGFILTDFEIINTHGGSIRVTAKRHGKEAELPEESLEWSGFRKMIEVFKQNTRVRLLSVMGPVAMFGATAKACTLIHNFGIASLIAYCIDETPQKRGRYIPGTGIRITPNVGEPKAVFLTAWNYEDYIRARFPDMRIITPWEQDKALPAECAA